MDNLSATARCSVMILVVMAFATIAAAADPDGSTGPVAVSGTSVPTASTTATLRATSGAVPNVTGAALTGISGNAVLTTASPVRIPTGRRRVYGFGSNAYGSLCLGYQSPATLTMPTPMTFSDRTSVQQASIGTTHALILSTVGDVYACGLQASGECGRGFSSGSILNPLKIPSDNWDSAVTKVVAGNRRSAVVTAGGKVYSFGFDGGGSLGLGTVSTCRTCGDCPCASSPMPITDGVDNVKLVDVSLAENYTMLLSDTGDVYIVGTGPERKFYSQATLVYTGAAAIAASGTCAFVVTAVGKVFGLGVRPSCGLGDVPTSIATTFEELTHFPPASGAHPCLTCVRGRVRVREFWAACGSRSTPLLLSLASVGASAWHLTPAATCVYFGRRVFGGW
eukprot:TRINITY_DN883_c0_g1_i1.p1 TRINITY_DN883_c0_g1~~TRINITY_DN883_c0_g1_i1.p1  ORF type:complete len:395 (+),score=105.89 TRINITY_DN883_c0_g1_i1:140-1324(+)